MFKTRLLSGIVLVLLALLFIIHGGYLLLTVLGIISLIGLFELYRVFGIEKSAPGIVGYVAAIVYYLNLVFDFKNIKSNRYYWFAWLNYLMGTVMFLIFYEKGFRMMHANFSWGYMHGMFFVFLMTLIVMVRNIREWWKSWKVIFVVGEIAVFCYHLVCGVNFLMYAVLGNDLAGF